MAKFNRFDPRNKKDGKHKQLHQIKDLKLREVDDRQVKKTLRKVKDFEKETYD
jgi:hypothetical protein